MPIPKIAVYIKIASTAFDKISNPILAEYNLTAAQYRVLKFLYSRQPKITRIVDIERECAITHPTALGLLDNLEKNGFVSKAVNPADARSKVVLLTEKAHTMQAELEEVGSRIDAILTENLSPAEKKDLLRLLKKLLPTEREVI